MDALVTYLRRRQDAYLADLAALVNLDCGTAYPAGVTRAAALLRGILEREGWTVRTLPVDGYGDCLEATVTGRGQARLMLLGHTDTVFPPGTAAERPMAIREGRIYGPGTNDMKAGLLTGVYAVAALRAAGWDDFDALTFFGNSDEEVGSPASAPLYAGVARVADAALVLEAARADGSIVSARKGGGHFYIQVVGRAAHAGVEPEHGANAILAAAHYVQALQALNGLRPGTTANVGVVRGGTVANAVADRVDLELDLRVTAAEDIPVVEEALRQAVAWTHVPGTAASVTGSFGARPMVRTPAIGFMADLAREVAADLGLSLRDVATGGLSDANKVAATGTPVLDGLGPVGGQDHSPGEYVDLASIVPRTALLAGLLRALAGQRERLLALRVA